MDAKERKFLALFLGFLAMSTASCGDGSQSVGPRESVEVPLNKLDVTVSGARTFTRSVDAGGGFYNIVRGSSSGGQIGGAFGVSIYADDVDGLPIAINVPGDPVPGVYSVGRWDPRIQSRPFFEAVLNVGRKSVVSLGTRPAFVLGKYASIEGGP